MGFISLEVGDDILEGQMIVQNITKSSILFDGMVIAPGSHVHVPDDKVITTKYLWYTLTELKRKGHVRIVGTVSELRSSLENIVPVSKEDRWKDEGRCPYCGEMGEYVNFAPKCSKHGIY